MANPDRRPGKTGRNPSDPSVPMPRLEHYLRPWEGSLVSHAVRARQGTLETGPSPWLPPASGVIDRASAVTDWEMLANGPDPANPPYAPSGLGDCVPVEAAHCCKAQTVYAGYPEPTFTVDAVVTAYSAIGGYVPGNESTDNGCDMATAVSYMISTGIPDSTGKVHKWAAAARFDPRNGQLRAQVLETFGSVYMGGLIQSAQEDQFAQGAVWRWVQGSSIAGGHAYGLQLRAVGGIGVHGLTTWGLLQHATGGFLWASLDPAQGGECYMVVSQDWITANGTTVQGADLEQLISDTQHFQGA